MKKKITEEEIKANYIALLTQNTDTIYFFAEETFNMKNLLKLINEIENYQENDELSDNYITEVFKLDGRVEIYSKNLEMLLYWHTNLKICEKNEDYEICGRIQKILQLEIDFLLKIDKKKYEEVINVFKNTFSI